MKVLLGTGKAHSKGMDAGKCRMGFRTVEKSKVSLGSCVSAHLYLPVFVKEGADGNRLEALLGPLKATSEIQSKK